MFLYPLDILIVLKFIKTLYVPTCNLRLFRPHSITEKYPDETINIIADGIMLSGTVDNPDRSPILVQLSNTNHLSFTTCIGNKRLIKAAMSLNSTISIVHESNLNLTAAQSFIYNSTGDWDTQVLQN